MDSSAPPSDRPQTYTGAVAGIPKKALRIVYIVGHTSADNQLPTTTAMSGPFARIQSGLPTESGVAAETSPLNQYTTLGKVKSEVHVLKEDMLAGEDPLGAIMASISRRSKCADAFLHCCAGVGLRCADTNRVPLLIACAVMGAVIFALSVCGATGLGPGSLDTLPWGAFTDAKVTGKVIAWWYCGSFEDSHGVWTCDILNNTRAWQHIIDVNVCTAQQIETSDCPTLLHFGQSLDEAHALATIDFNFNQWGMCVFPKDVWVREFWQGGPYAGQGTATPFTVCGHSFCRKWGDFHAPPSLGDFSAALLVCQRPTVDAFTLIMACVGGFIKIFEPFSRMTKAKDNSQKTIVLLIGAISVIAPTVAVVQFRTGCLETIDHTFRDLFQTQAIPGAGYICFYVSIILSVPIYSLHILIPSTIRSARASQQDALSNVEG